MQVIYKLLIITFLSGVNSSPFRIKEPELNVLLNDTAVLVGECLNSPCAASQIYVHFKGNDLVTGGTTVSSGKYFLSVFQTNFTFSIYQMTDNDYGTYTFSYVTLPIVTVVNATVNKLVIVEQVCPSVQSFVAVFVFILLGYLFHLMSAGILYLTKESQNTEKKRERSYLILIAVFLTLGTSLITAMLAIWALYFDQPVNYLMSIGSILGIIGYLIILISIFYQFLDIVNRNFENRLRFKITILLFILIQLGFFIGIVLITFECANIGFKLPPIDTKYETVAILLSVLIFIQSLVMTLFFLAYYKIEKVRDLMAKISSSQFMNNKVNQSVQSDMHDLYKDAETSMEYQPERTFMDRSVGSPNGLLIDEKKLILTSDKSVDTGSPTLRSPLKEPISNPCLDKIVEEPEIKEEDAESKDNVSRISIEKDKKTDKKDKKGSKKKKK